MARGLLGIVMVFVWGVASAEPLALVPASARTNFFAGREATLGSVIRGGEPVAGRLAWTLSAFGRTLAGGAFDLRHDGGRGTPADVGVVIPEIEAGVCVEAAFTAVLADATGRTLATHTRQVRILSGDPFVDRVGWLRSLRLALFDPVGETERVLGEASVPFTLVRSEADLAAAAPRIIVVGEGTSWLDRPDLPGLVTRCASRGVPVLCLAPLDGTLPLPGSNVEGEAVVRRLAFERAEIVAAVDPRLDDRDWVAEGRTIVSRLAIVAEGDRAVIRVAAAADDPAGWPWLEIDHAGHGAAAAKLVVCGYGIVNHWDATPSARYLFAALLARLTAAQPGDRPDSSPADAIPEKCR